MSEESEPEVRKEASGIDLRSKKLCDGMAIAHFPSIPSIIPGNR